MKIRMISTKGINQFFNSSKVHQLKSKVALIFRRNWGESSIFVIEQAATVYLEFLELVRLGPPATQYGRPLFFTLLLTMMPVTF